MEHLNGVSLEWNERRNEYRDELWFCTSVVRGCPNQGERILMCGKSEIWTHTRVSSRQELLQRPGAKSK